MTITTPVPSNLREPNTFQVIDTTSGPTGLVPLARRVALVGQLADFAPASPNVPVQVFSAADGDLKGGQSSEIAMMVRAAIKAAKKYGVSPELWICPIVDPSGSKATLVLTWSGTATESGTARFKLQGQDVSVGIASGDTAAVMAANANKAVKAKAANFAAVSTVASAVQTLTLVNAGVNGNNFGGSVVSLPAGVGLAIAAGVAGSGDADPQPALDALIDKIYNRVVVANNKIADLDALADHIATENDFGTKRFTEGVIANVGNLTSGTTLSTHANQKELMVVNAYGCPRMPSEIATHVGVTIEAEDDTARSFDNVELDLEAPPAAKVPDSGSGSTVETALAAGLCILGVNADNSKMRIIRAVTTKSTQNGAPLDDLLDVSNIRTLFWLALQVDARWKRDFPREKQNERTRDRVFSSTLDVLKKAEAIERIKNVDAHKAELQVEVDPVVVTRYNVPIPATLIPNLHQLVGIHRMILE